MNRKRLEAVLRIRVLQERSARGEMARSNQRHRRAQAHETRTWERLDAWAADTPCAIPGATLGTTPGATLVAQSSLRQAGVLAADTQHLVTERAWEGVVDARDEWTVTARRVEALERLSERLGEVESEERERAQSNELDDLVLARRALAKGTP